jgi:hypothetical protein
LKILKKSAPRRKMNLFIGMDHPSPEKLDMKNEITSSAQGDTLQKRHLPDFEFQSSASQTFPEKVSTTGTVSYPYIDIIPTWTHIFSSLSSIIIIS